jgi:hypothetical protein
VYNTYLQRLYSFIFLLGTSGRRCVERKRLCSSPAMMKAACAGNQSLAFSRIIYLCEDDIFESIFYMQLMLFDQDFFQVFGDFQFINSVIVVVPVWKAYSVLSATLFSIFFAVLSERRIPSIGSQINYCTNYCT